eukprot:UN00883
MNVLIILHHHQLLSQFFKFGWKKCVKLNNVVVFKQHLLQKIRCTTQEKNNYFICISNKENRNK